MEEINRIRLKLAKANDANDNTNNSGKDYMTIRDSLTDISLLLCRVERAVGECSNENSGLNIPVVSNNEVRVAVCDCSKPKYVLNEHKQVLICCGCGRQYKLAN